ncbi:MAG TPA: hypothetical protein VF030_00105 [Solirubrobacterales bacterium]
MVREAGNLRRSLAVLAAVAIAVLASIFVAGQMSASAAGGGTASASAQNFEESLRMRITYAEGKRITAKGTATGTLDGKVSFKLRTIDGSKARATFFGRNSYGTMRGTGTAKYSVNGAITTYTGKIKTLEGTGRYAGASSRGISLQGTANRRSFKVKMTLNGKWDA